MNEIDLINRKEEIESEMLQIASTIKRLQGKIGGHKAKYNRLRDEQIDLNQLILKQQKSLMEK